MHLTQAERIARFRSGKNEPSNEWSLLLLIVTALALAVCYLILNIYGLNKGFSLWDESYYLLSYEMASQGFFRHFNNTPFLVAFLFEAFHPSLIGYRAIHLGISLIGSGVLAIAIVHYLQWSKFPIRRVGKWIIFSLSLVGAAYTYQISVSTLSYNHLNEFLILVAEGIILLAMTKTGVSRSALLFLAGFVFALDIYVKPTTYLSISLALTAFVAIVEEGKRAFLKTFLTFGVGVAVSLGLSLIFFYPPKQWSSYLTLMAVQQAHSPYKVLYSFLSSAFDMLKAGVWFILTGLVLALWLIFSTGRFTLKPYRMIGVGVGICLVLLHAFFAMRFLAPDDIWTSFNVHWWYWWVYSATVALITLTINLFLGCFLLTRDGIVNKKRVLMLMLLLAANPIGMSVGTLNGFGQVQIHLSSWLLLSGVVVLIALNAQAKLAERYASLLVVLSLAVGAIYFCRQLQPLNFAGQGALNEQTHQLSFLTKLAGVSVDGATYDVLLRSKEILDGYPDLPTVSFFDLPGMQYAFNRKWIVLDPWLTNYEMPLTKDDAYNCQAIALQPDYKKGAIFIVSHQKSISPGLMECLQRIGFPKETQLIGSVNTKLGYMDEPIRFYLKR